MALKRVDNFPATTLVWKIYDLFCLFGGTCISCKMCTCFKLNGITLQFPGEHYSNFLNMLRFSRWLDRLRKKHQRRAWWRHQMETSSVLLALCAGKFTGHRSPPQRPVARSFDVFVDLRLNQRLSKQSGRRWFETYAISLTMTPR